MSKREEEGNSTFATRVVVLELDALEVGEIDVHASAVREKEVVVHAALGFVGISDVTKLNKRLPNFLLVKDEDLFKRQVS